MNEQVKVEDVLKAYNLLVKGIESQANDDPERAYGGIVRAGKGAMVESICRLLVEIAWSELGGDSNRLSFKKETYKLPLNPSYLDRLANNEVSDYIRENIKEYFYLLKEDVHVSIDDKFILAIECKAYTENAMLKRILVDFTLLKELLPDIKCMLFQLESQLGGDYSKVSTSITYGSHSTHTLLSYFNVDLYIVTLLEGERKVDNPIHKPDFYKPLEICTLVKAINTIMEILTPYL